MREFAHHAAEGVDLDLAGASRAAQLEIVRFLDPALADAEIRQLDQRIVAVQLVFRDRRDIAHDMRDGVGEGIIPDQALLDRHARKIERVDVDAGHLVPIHVLADRHRDKAVLVADVAQHAAAVAVAQRHQRGNGVERRRDIAGLFGHQHGPVGGPVHRQGHAETVDDAPARRRQ